MQAGGATGHLIGLSFDVEIEEKCLAVGHIKNLIII
jgi:hypothetical protein